MKDILVDNNVGKNFCNPLDPEYKNFIEWLFREGALVVTVKLMQEYIASSGASSSPTNMPAIIDKLLREGRLNLIANKVLKAFRISRRTERFLIANRSDWNYLKAVMISLRKYALSLDDNFRYDVNNFPGYTARAEARPQDIPYSV